ncbi:E3 ubiquitin-protein ligase bre1, partial [Dimargaris xerosporica]
ALLEAKQAHIRADQLQAQLTELHARYGLNVTENPDKAANDSDTVITQLRVKVDEHAKKASDLEMECAALRVAEQQMLKELENISEGWGQLHEQNSRKVLDLAKRDDQVQHFNAERVKFHQKFVALNKVKDQQYNTNMALKRQVDKVTAYSKSLEDREKNLDNQVKALDKELQASQDALKACKSRLEELMLRNGELTDNVGRAEQRVNEVQRVLSERTAQLEKEAHHARRIGEECAGYKRKLDRASKDQMDEQLRSERDEYKALLKCSSCSTRFKSHVLLRCMHVFCHECIQARLETRQRKCPSCAEPFGANDVKKIFL